MQEAPVILITGGGRGLGRAFALALAKTGAKVAVTARTGTELAETVQLITQEGGHGLALPADVTDGDAIAQVVAAVENQLGPIDVLINNAGVLRALGEVAAVEPDEWWREVEINLRGPYLCSRAVLPGMITRKSGRIINVASGAGLHAVWYGSAYCTGKAALIRLSEAMALETRAHGITVLAVDPGTVRTPMNDYVLTSPRVAAMALPVQEWFRELYAAGDDTPLEQTVAFMVDLVSGRADVLSGCFVSVGDDLDALLADAAAIEEEQKRMLRLRV